MGHNTRTGTGPPLDPSQYERLIDDGLASAGSHGGAVDHVTARRLAIWLSSRPQQSDFTRGLVHFTQTGAITHALKPSCAPAPAPPPTRTSRRPPG